MKHPEVPKRAPADPEDSSRTPSQGRVPPFGIVDRGGVMWWVSERDTRRDPGSPAERCLLFANERAIRRVWSYPRDWAKLSDAELDALACTVVIRPLTRGRIA